MTRFFFNFHEKCIRDFVVSCNFLPFQKKHSSENYPRKKVFLKLFILLKLFLFSLYLRLITNSIAKPE